MADVEGQEDATTVDMRASSSIMEASCVVPIEAVGSSHGCRGEDEDYILQKTASVTVGVEIINTVDGSVHGDDNKSGSMEDEVRDESNRGATVVFNKDDSNITCSCRMFESIGILCKHALRVFNRNGVYNLPSQYILPRWTKYAKTGFYIETQGTDKEDLKTQVAVISREATSLALKCLPSKELLDKLQKAIHNLSLEADTYLSEMHEKSNEVPATPNECAREPLNGAISFKIPQVIKGPKNTRFKNVVEKNPGKKKKKKTAQKKGEDLNNDIQKRNEHADPTQMTDSNVGPSLAVPPFMQGGYGNSTTPIMTAPFMQGGYANSTMPIMAAPSTMSHLNSIANPSGMATPYIPGGYTSLLFGVDQDATMQTAVRKLHFDGVPHI